MRSEDYDANHRNVRVDNPGGDIHHQATRGDHQGITVTLAPAVAGDETAERRIREAEITSAGESVIVRLPDMPTTVINSGDGMVVHQNFGTITGTVVGMQVNGTITGGLNIASGGDIRVNGMRISNGTQHIGGGGSVTVTIDAPAGSGLVARSTGGDIHQHGISGALDVDTTGGDIRIEHVTTTAELHTSGGNVHIDIAACPVEARTSGGNVTGRNLCQGGSLRTSGGNVTAHLTGEHRLTARTSGGNVTLTTAAGVSEDHLTWRASGGNVRVNDTKCKNKSSV